MVRSYFEGGGSLGIDTTTYCSDCEHVLKANKSDSPRWWLCRMHRRLEGMGFVQRNTWTNAEPFLRCRDVNGGACPMFEFATGEIDVASKP